MDFPHPLSVPTLPGSGLQKSLVRPVQPLDNHRYVGHRGKLQEHEPTDSKQFREHFQHIGRAVLQQKDLFPGKVPSRRIKEYDVWPEVPDYAFHRVRRRLRILYEYVRGSQSLEVVPRRRSKFRIHLIVKHFRRHLAERPRVHSKPACQVGDPAGLSDSSGHFDRLSHHFIFGRRVRRSG